MGEKMLITQALTEKETLQDEICRLIQESSFVLQIQFASGKRRLSKES